MLRWGMFWLFALGLASSDPLSRSTGEKDGEIDIYDCWNENGGCA